MSNRELVKNQKETVAEITKNADAIYGAQSKKGDIDLDKFAKLLAEANKNNNKNIKLFLDKKTLVGEIAPDMSDRLGENSNFRRSIAEINMEETLKGTA